MAATWPTICRRRPIGCEAVRPQRTSRSCRRRCAPRLRPGGSGHGHRPSRHRRVSPRAPGGLHRRCDGCRRPRLGDHRRVAAFAAVARAAEPAGRALYRTTKRPAGKRRCASSARSATCWSRRKTPKTLIAALAVPATSIVSFTVTEKGYCRERQDGSLGLARRGGRLQVALPRTIYGCSRAALRARRADAASGLTLLSAATIWPGNGRSLPADARIS